MSVFKTANAFAVGAVSLGNKGRDQAPLVLLIFVAAQVLDALLTYRGVMWLGIDVELNALLAGAMRDVGPGPTLAVAKTVACLCGLFLYTTARHRTLAVTTGLSIGIAVVPWCVVHVQGLVP